MIKDLLINALGPYTPVPLGTLKFAVDMPWIIAALLIVLFTYFCLTSFMIVIRGFFR